MKKVLKEWNAFVREGDDDFDSEGNLNEGPINEAIFTAAAIGLLGKLFVFFLKALQSKKELHQLNATVQQSDVPEEAKEVVAQTMSLLDTIEKNAPAIDKLASITGAGGNLNPLNWKTNALIALIKGAVKTFGGKADDPPAGERANT